MTCTIKIHKGVTTIVDVAGAGPKCQEITAFLEKLGTVDESSRQLTSSYHEPVEEARSISIQQ